MALIKKLNSVNLVQDSVISGKAPPFARLKCHISEEDLNGRIRPFPGIMFRNECSVGLKGHYKLCKGDLRHRIYTHTMFVPSAFVYELVLAPDMHT